MRSGCIDTGGMSLTMHALTMTPAPHGACCCHYCKWVACQRVEFVLCLWWSAGSYHGLNPTFRQSADYGVLHATADKQGKVTDVTIWRGGFAEEREVLVSGQTCICSKKTCMSLAGCPHVKCAQQQAGALHNTLAAASIVVWRLPASGALRNQA